MTDIIHLSAKPINNSQTAAAQASPNPHPEIVIVAALAVQNRVIGKNGRLPWHFPDDLRRFKAMTWGHSVIMGRVTWEQGLGQRILPHRLNIVVSSTLAMPTDTFRESVSPPNPKDTSDESAPASQSEADSEDITQLVVARSLTEAIAYGHSDCKNKKAHLTPPIFIIGGASLYHQTLPMAHRLELTLVDGEFEGDTYFPDYGPLLSEFKCVSSSSTAPLTYISYVRRPEAVSHPITAEG